MLKAFRVITKSFDVESIYAAENPGKVRADLYRQLSETWNYTFRDVLLDCRITRSPEFDKVAEKEAKTRSLGYRYTYQNIGFGILG